jgi:hypothetical protein
MSVFPSKVNFVTGDILTATDMNEIGQAINLLDGAQRSAGKNAIINGDFGIWQRGTSFTPSAAWNYNADRFAMFHNGTGTTPVVSRQTFTPGTAPVAGYEGTYFWRYSQAAAGSGNTINWVQQRIEDVRQFAGQTVTFSFWAKADAARTVNSNIIQNFGSGGSSDTIVGTSHSLTTAWQRFTYTVLVPSIAGKTVGTNSFLIAEWNFPVGVAQTIDIWGVQLEYANTASNFQTATGTKQGELAACQRYYQRITAEVAYQNFGVGYFGDTTTARVLVPFKTTMRVAPSFATSGSFDTQAGFTSRGTAAPTLVGDGTNTQIATLNSVVSGATAAQAAVIRANNSTTTFIEFSSEL